MSSEPSPSATPIPAVPPPQNAPMAPVPLVVGKQFSKHYYKTLVEKPALIGKFYKADSTFSRGMEPSAPTDAVPVADFYSTAAPTDGEDADATTPEERIRKTFFDWAGKGIEELASDSENGEGHLRIDFERGSIDAQESLGGGILLVVTGHMYLPSKPLSASPFVHTFFLNNGAPPGRKRQFYVKNDVLRFLMPVSADNVVEEEEVVATVSAVVEEEAPIPVEEQPIEEEEVPVSPADITEEAEAVLEEEDAVEETKAEAPELSEEPVEIPVETTPVESAPVEKPLEYSAAPVEETTEAAVEETKEEVVEPAVEDEPAVDEEKVDLTEATSDSPEASPTSEGKRKRNRRRRGGKSSRSNSPPNGAGDRDDGTETKEEEQEEAQPEKPKTPGSWASLVAGGSGPTFKEDGSGGKGKGGSKQDRRGRSPKGQREDKAASTASGTTNHDSSAQSPPQSQQPSDRPSTKETTSPESISAPSVPATTPAPQSQILSNQRTPEATLFIRNIPDATKEPEIRALFEPHGAKTGNKILGVTLNANRGFCFVDFDGPTAVNAIVAEAHSSLIKDNRTGRKIESSFMVHGRVLDVEKKVKSQPGGGMGMGGGRRYNRSPPGSRGSRGSGMGGRRSSGGANR